MAQMCPAKHNSAFQKAIVQQRDDSAVSVPSVAV